MSSQLGFLSEACAESLSVKESSFIDSLSPMKRRFFGFFLSILAGFFYGTNFDPPQWLIDHNRGSKLGICLPFLGCLLG